ncbi:hypothetical protein Nepgr_032261 [Nepenthes gracilis]|uniref:Secreted protein n=1 Tax=Nepenthes gracilis TaxID=150966 RepID=A0AAD3Y5W9_NEPGR|nr:hypothetical protein Nepgr_032261 [Nepenthes gracilis]
MKSMLTWIELPRLCILSSWLCRNGINAGFISTANRPICRSGFMSRFGLQNELPISNCIPYADLDCCSFRLHQLPIAIGRFIPVLELSCRSRIVIGFGLPAFCCQWYGCSAANGGAEIHCDDPMLC